MILRPYIPCLDFDIIKTWAGDRRTHAMWCADRTEYPLERDGFDSLLENVAVRFGDCPFIAADDDGQPVGFFCYSINTESREGMFKFVIVSPERRGMGYGREMLTMAVKYAFEFTGATAVRLSVFSVNAAAKRCYQSVGFEQRSVQEDAFCFSDELWGRCNMVMERPADNKPL